MISISATKCLLPLHVAVGIGLQQPGIRQACSERISSPSGDIAAICHLDDELWLFVLKTAISPISFHNALDGRKPSPKRL
ncbi:MAG: hypothetical protein ACE5R6_15375 [Candidatus Heimdallarchaeota archaeon]